MVRDILEVGVVLGLAIGGVAVAIYEKKIPLVIPQPVPIIEFPAPPPPPVAPLAPVSAEGEMPLQAATRDPQLIVIPLPRAHQALDKIEDHLTQIQQIIDRIEKKADEK